MSRPSPMHPAARTAIGFIATGFIPFLLLVDTLVAMRSDWRPSLWLEWAVLWTIAIWSFLCLLVLIVPRTRQLYSAGSTKLVIMHGTIGLLLLGGQAPFTALSVRPEIPFHHRAPNQERVFRPDPTYIRGIPGESTYTINSRGIRGPELDSSYDRKLLFVGGSTTECFYLDDAEMWSYLCAQRLQQEFSERTIWAGSVGRAGYTTVQHLKYVQENDRMSEYDTIVFMIGANDLLVWLNFKRPSPTPYWKGTGYFTVSQTLLTTVWPSTNPMAENPTGSAHQLRREARANGHVVDTHPPIEEWLQTYEQRVIDIIDTCLEKGIRPVLVTQPTLWVKEGKQIAETDLWTGRVRGTNEFLSIPILRELLDQFNAVTLRVCAAHNVPCVDLDSMSGEYEYFYDDFHFTEAGARAVADSVTDVLRDTFERRD